ncbi:MAG: putative N-acetylglucosamine-6-phosphate deacetylase [Ferruginibacter sp.]|nr:putative N-acetylglucosamine-6-phosphate deacetylase [Ferruginibacter sp.]
MTTAIINGNIIGGNPSDANHIILVKDGVVTGLAAEVPAGAHIINLKGRNISAGFIDIQLNGGYEYYFMQTPAAAALDDMVAASADFGTAFILPCLISSSKENILQAIETVREYMQDHPAVLGMHLEGPFINPAKRGAHVKELVRKPTNAELEEIIRYGKDVIRVMTIAPECFADEQLQLLIESGITLSAGHTEMDYTAAQKVFSKGIQLVTHLYNAMTQMGHRSPGLVGAVLDNDQVYAPIILDGAHCDYAMARIAWKAKQEKLILLSDAAFLGRQKTSFEWNGFTARLQNGFYRNEEGNLAGAAISMVEAIQNAIMHVGIPLSTAIDMATIRVAQAIGMEDKIGKIKAGYPARFAVFDDRLEQIETLVL